MGRIVITIMMVMSCICANAQTNVLLSIQGMGGEGYDEIYHNRVTPTYDGGFIITISSSSATDNINTDCTLTGPRGLVNKYNADGTVLEWQKCSVGTIDSGFSYIFPQPDGSFVRGGEGNYDFIIRKEDANGNIIWGSKHYGGSNDDVLYDMVASSDGGFIMLGISYSNDGDVGQHYGAPMSEDIWVLKLDSMGNKVWSRALGGSDMDLPSGLALAPGNGCYVLGMTYSSDHECINYHGNRDAFIARLGDSGQVIWSRCIGGSGQEGDLAGGTSWITDDKKGGALISLATKSADGDIHGNYGQTDIWVADIDSNNNTLWDKHYGGTGYDNPLSIAAGIDGSIWIGGGTASTDGDVNTSYGGGDAWLIHTDSVGNILSTKILGEPQDDWISAVHPLANGTVFIAGQYTGAGPVGGEFPSQYWGLEDVFLARIAPWTTFAEGVVQKEPNVDVYPNPATEKITVRLAGDGNKMNSLAIFDMYGRRITQYTLANSSTLQVDVSNWPKGVYFLRLADEVGDEHTTTIAIQ